MEVDLKVNCVIVRVTFFNKCIDLLREGAKRVENIKEKIKYIQMKYTSNRNKSTSQTNQPNQIISQKLNMDLQANNST
jgi:hypothetical protein